MKLQNGDIFTAQEPLRKLIEQKFPVIVSYKLSKLAQKLNEQFKVVEEVRQGLIKKYGKADDKGQIAVSQESKDWVKFVDEFNELMAQEVEIVIEKVKLPETFEIEPSILMALDKFVEV